MKASLAIRVHDFPTSWQVRGTEIERCLVLAQQWQLVNVLVGGLLPNNKRPPLMKTRKHNWILLTKILM